VPLIVWAGKKDSSPLALYLLLMFVIPPLEVKIPTIGIGQLFDLSNLRLLTLCILLPAAWTRLARAGRGEPIRLSAVDVILLTFGLLQLVLLFPYEALTNTMRRAFLFFLDAYLVYFSFSRLLTDRAKIADTLSALCLAAAIFAPIAVFESLRGWLLYIGIGEMWGPANRDAYLLRGDSLRAQAAAGHSIVLGHVFALAIGAWLYLKAFQEYKTKNAAVLVLLSVGLFFTYARGPWLTAAVLALVFAILSARNAASIVKSMLAMVVILGVLSLTPFGAKIFENLPFVGTQGQETVAYRQQLAEVSWALIKQNPWFGNPFVMLQMEELRPGQGGIIDLVNGYAQVALFYGLVGLALFVAVFLIALKRSYAALRRSRAMGDDDMVLLGSSLIACTASTLFLIATAGSSYHQWLLAGFLVSYAGLQTARNIAPDPVPFNTGAARRRRTFAGGQIWP
jgi:O-antigen ligase